MLYIRYLTFNILGVILLMEFIIQPPVQSTGSIHNRNFYNAVNALLFIESQFKQYFHRFYIMRGNFLQNGLI